MKENKKTKENPKAEKKYLYPCIYIPQGLKGTYQRLTKIFDGKNGNMGIGVAMIKASEEKYLKK